MSDKQIFWSLKRQPSLATASFLRQIKDLLIVKVVLFASSYMDLCKRFCGKRSGFEDGAFRRRFLEIVAGARPEMPKIFPSGKLLSQKT